MYVLQSGLVSRKIVNNNKEQDPLIINLRLMTYLEHRPQNQAEAVHFYLNLDYDFAEAKKLSFPPIHQFQSPPHRLN